MKTRILLWLICGISWLGFSQSVTQIEYFFNTDLGLGSNTVITAAANSGDLEQTFDITFPTSLEGFNILYVRLKDDNNAWSLYDQRPFYIVPDDSPSNIESAEYFINNGPATSLTVDPNTGELAQAYAINLDNSLEGFNTLYIRVKDNNDNWSLYDQRAFYIVPDEGGPNNIMSAEYFINSDPGIGVATPLSVNGNTGELEQMYALNLDASLEGFNTLYIRVKDNNGKWSLYDQRTFYIEPDQTILPITSLEYFFDTDPGFGAGTVATLNPTGNPDEYTVDLETTDLDCGLHDFYIRIKNQGEVWSLYDLGLGIEVTSATDVDPPVLEDVVEECAATVTAPTTSLFCADQITGTTTDPLTYTEQGTFEITWTFDDGEGNVVESMQNVIIDDITPPELTAVGNFDENLDGNCEFIVPDYTSLTTATDNCTTPTIIQTPSPGTVLTGQNSQHIITLEADDGNDNTNSISFTITLLGNTVFYADEDEDGFGDPNNTISDCEIPVGYVTDNTDCDDTMATVFPGAPELCDGLDNDCDGLVDDNDPDLIAPTTWYADTDSDGFGDINNALSQCTQPIGYVADNTDCNDTDNTIFPFAEEICDSKDNDCDGLIDGEDPDVTGLTTWYADTDGDGFGDSGNSTLACTQPPGFVLNSTDCDDTDGNLNPNNPSLQFSSSANYTSALVYPLSGATDTGFTFEVEYTDVNNGPPPATFPRLLLDFEGNGSLTDANDLTLIMTEADLNDMDTNDGKRYTVTVPALPAGTNWESSVQVINGSCTTTLGAFNYPDVFVLPDLQIFANDISFSNPNPDLSSEITVFATVHNISDFDALNFDVHLENQAEPGTIFTDINIPILPANSSTTVSWLITTPPTEGWNPMLVSIDHTNVIAETIETNNTAIRPFTNGDFNVPGNIVLTANTNPNTTYNTFGNTVAICGNAIYTDTAVTLANPVVAGATVTINIIETGASYTTYTNANGNYCFNVPVSQAIGTYNAEVSITDFTLSTTESASFEIIEPPCLPDLKTTVSVSESNILIGESISGTITIKNQGCAATTITSLLDISNNGGSPTISDDTIPVLNPGETFTTTFSNITYTQTGKYLICAYADANLEIEEGSEANNYDCAEIRVAPILPDLKAISGPSQNTCTEIAPSLISFSISNSETVASGAFTAIVNIYFDGSLIQTVTENISNLDAGAIYNFDEPFSYNSGSYAFELIVDSNNDVAESNESNNLVTFNQSITTCIPNLAFYPENCDDDKIDVSVDPVFPGTASYSAQIYNKGDGTATGPFDVDFLFSGGQVLTATYNGILSPGANTTVSVDGPTVQSGTETLTVNIDSNNDITERNELDNSGSGDLCWDFAFDTASCIETNFWDNIQPINKPIYFSMGFDLFGLYDASAVDVLYEVSGPGLTGTVNAGTVTINDLESNCNCPYRADLSVPFVFPQVGVYTITATLDPSNGYIECDETNNVITVEVNVTNLPDMQILAQYINPSELNPDIGEAINIDITYENIGASNPGDQMELCVYADGTLIETVSNVDGLLTGMNNTISLTSTYSSIIAGAHILSAEIDCADAINESDELNNEATRAIVVGDAGNLKFTSFIASDSSPNLSDNIDITAIIENEGNAEVDADVLFYYTDNTLNEVQIAGPFSISLDAGQNTTIQFPWSVLDENTIIIGRIVNSSPYEYNYDDNEAILQLGNLNINIESTPSCYGETNGSLTANVTGGTPPYSYMWNDGSLQNSITGTAGMYTLTVTDNTGFSVMLEAEIVNDDTDSDGDSIPDCKDICPDFDDNLDTDSDTIPDGCDNCPNDFNQDQVDADGDGVGDTCDICPDGDDLADTDDDGIPNECDSCPLDFLNDSDGDGVCDSDDICPGGDDNSDSDGDGIPDFCDSCDNSVDTDNDGINDCDDLEVNSPCPIDVDSDGISKDSDGDGIPNCLDACEAFDDLADADGDSVPDGCDVCTGDDASGDNDGDGVCDDSDPCPLDPADDSDNDGVCDSNDICPGGDDSIDSDGDGIPDFCDSCDNSVDTDNDGVNDCDDLEVNSPCPLDVDSDGVSNDSDGDGVQNCLDACEGSDDLADADGDSVPDGCDVCVGDDASGDTDGDSVCDDIDPCPLDASNDSDGDGVCDSDDICPGFDDLSDSDGDAVPDGCDLCDGDDTTGDSDNDGVCDSNDNCPDNPNPDQTDSDNNGIGDICDDTECDELIITSINLPADPFPMGSNISAVANYLGDEIVSATWDWGDGSTSNGTISQSTIFGNHTYQNPGVYEVMLTIIDICDAETTEFFKYVVIYDSSGGFVTGGGWIDSPLGAYVPDPTLTGKANFGFVSKYKKGKSIPDGHTEFQFHAGNLNFKSSVYEWLIVAGTKAMFKGSGTINNEGYYKFILSAKDESKKGGDDTFRIKIWDAITEIVVYDNQLGDDDNADATLAISGGSIMVHQKGKAKAKESVSKNDESSGSTFTVDYWPSPSETNFNLRLISQKELGNTDIFVFDVNNRLVHNNQFNGNKVYSFGTNLESGVYMVRIVHINGIKTFKLVKY